MRKNGFEKSVITEWFTVLLANVNVPTQVTSEMTTLATLTDVRHSHLFDIGCV